MEGRRRTALVEHMHSERTPVVSMDVIVCSAGSDTGRKGFAVLDTRPGMLPVFRNTACSRVLATCYLSEVTHVEYAAGNSERRPVVEVHRSDRDAIRLTATDGGTIRMLFDALLSSCCNWSRERHSAPDCLQAEAGDCCVCLSPNTVNTKLEPCNHEVCCSECAARLSSCPICRAPIVHVLAGSLYGRQGTVEKPTLQNKYRQNQKAYNARSSRGRGPSSFPFLAMPVAHAHARPGLVREGHAIDEELLDNSDDEGAGRVLKR